MQAPGRPPAVCSLHGGLLQSSIQDFAKLFRKAEISGFEKSLHMALFGLHRTIFGLLVGYTS
jgi:hypothetical protein